MKDLTPMRSRKLIKENWKDYARMFMEGKKMLDLMERKHAILATEFERYIVEHPEFAAEILENSQIVLQVEGDEKYNRWSRNIAKKQREGGRPPCMSLLRG